MYRFADHAFTGNADAGEVLRAKGYRGSLSLVPQFGIDPDTFRPSPALQHNGTRIGFAGRVVEEKGILVLLDALRELSGAWTLRVMGSGPLVPEAQRRAFAYGIAERVIWEPGVPSLEMPARLQELDVLVLPSLTRPNWKEQFGRILVEAMACQVAVVASRSGEIPTVVGDVGVLVPESDPAALATAIRQLIEDPDRRADLGRRGRERVLARYTHRRIAEQTVDAYQQIMNRSSP